MLSRFVRGMKIGIPLFCSALIVGGCFLGPPLRKDFRNWQKLEETNNRFFDWKEVFSSPTKLNVTAIHTGNVLTGPSILIDAEDPSTPASEKKERWVPSLSYLVQHPKFGKFLMDSGVPAVNEEGRCDFSLIGSFYTIPCKSEKGSDIGNILTKMDIPNEDILFVIVSHLHWDHIGGMESLRKRGPIRILLSKEEADDASKAFAIFHGYAPKALSIDFEGSVLPGQNYYEMPILGKVLDLFGDGSVWIIPAFGHTKGELAVLLNTPNQPLLFTFDASHLKAGFEKTIPPGATVNRKESIAALRKLNSFSKAFPRIKVIYGHEPSQWEGKNRIFLLAGHSSHNVRR
ncbi:metallo-beta-lactamase domain protein [Leptospira inadai serovar Lyme str. 10]|uniref:Metallo-beta-lactamase domain protein n=3 Tax=Leptospira inadai TaxID=29506 RepID=V6HHH9_9LEPT|nr:metallo-beta-lactamase domain protein [Leptospira inadai serovar Lyme str. 10]PNV76772.1 MBL fold metallo-hydrolase [Leptospira inadai serovar Lyme]